MVDREQNLWLPSMVSRVCLFLFFFSLLVLSLFLLGNFQSFLDSTQRMLLSVFETTSLLYVVAALFNVVMLVVLAGSRSGRWRAISLILSLLGAGIFVGLHLLFGFIIAWLRPLN